MPQLETTNKQKVNSSNCPGGISCQVKPGLAVMTIVVVAAFANGSGTVAEVGTAAATPCGSSAFILAAVSGVFSESTGKAAVTSPVALADDGPSSVASSKMPNSLSRSLK